MLLMNQTASWGNHGDDGTYYNTPQQFIGKKKKKMEAPN